MFLWGALVVPWGALGPALLAAAVVQVGLLVDTRVIFQEGPGDTGGASVPPLFGFFWRFWEGPQVLGRTPN